MQPENWKGIEEKLDTLEILSLYDKVDQRDIDEFLSALADDKRAQVESKGEEFVRMMTVLHQLEKEGKLSELKKLSSSFGKKVVGFHDINNYMTYYYSLSFNNK